ncbi:hypothetical protein [Culturomica massiliensis]|uniref:hypothetical protein n=1 Tax=Culturomica massiliensis TaxID=1841857 RepID=UPI00266F2917|nr:hypothetical protein [Culturomica massiliensis]
MIKRCVPLPVFRLKADEDIQTKNIVLARDEMAFLLIIFITSLRAMLPRRKGSCQDLKIAFLR